MTSRLAIYRWINSNVVGRFAVPQLVGSEWSRRGEQFLSDLARRPLSFGSTRPVWFHAASVGELESLWTVIEGWERPAGLTVFSGSAAGALARLEEAVRYSGREFLFSGASPWEGRWREALTMVRPSAFVTAKYEAWPELWAALAEMGIPLVIVGARPRRSLKLAKSVSSWLGSCLPEMVLIPALASDAKGLSEEFPMARIELCGEPRWDRVWARTQHGNARARELLGRLAELPRPWGIFGSAWPEDLTQWKGRLGREPGTSWVVPHRIDAEMIGKITELVQAEGADFVLTSSLNRDPEAQPVTNGRKLVVIVDEMGFLSELYSGADWAFVGGGFGKGLHSTIEPAIHGIPLAGGPARTGSFPEVQELQESGQLTVVQGRVELDLWRSRLPQVGLSERARWKEQAERRMGASARVTAVLTDLARR